jgi:alkaline phosphatase
MPVQFARCLIAVVVLIACAPVRAEQAQPDKQPQVKNVIVLIADGCSTEAYTLARWFTGEPLATDAIRCGVVKTHIANSVVADSAPAASAFATGVRTTDKFISVGPAPETLSTVPPPPADLPYRPLATVLEGARLLGKATGIAVTCRVTHATPAAFMAHVPARDQEFDIMEQAVHQGVDVVFGGGTEYLLPAAAGGRRPDGQNLADVLKQRGYRIVRTREEMTALKSPRAFGMFAPGHMAPEIDRPELAASEPTLEQMTRKAIELLGQNPKGFFLMVEGSQIDWAAHANDPSQLVSDLVMFDRAVRAALDFAERDGHTLVLAVSDHCTGGLSIGRYGVNYSQMKVEELVDPLKKMKCSAPAMWKKLGTDKTPENVRRVVEELWGMKITEEDARELLAVAAKEKGSPHNAFGRVLSAKYTMLGWTTHGHHGGDVPLGAFGPGRPVGVVDGPEIGRLVASALGLNLQKLNERLFVDAAKALPEAKVTPPGKGKGPVVEIELGGRTARLPVNKNLMEIDGRTIPLEGVVIYAAKTKKVYLPLQAIRLLQSDRGELPAVAR